MSDAEIYRRYRQILESKEREERERIRRDIEEHNQIWAQFSPKEQKKALDELYTPLAEWMKEEKQLSQAELEEHEREQEQSYQKILYLIANQEQQIEFVLQRCLEGEDAATIERSFLSSWPHDKKGLAEAVRYTLMALPVPLDEEISSSQRSVFGLRYYIKYLERS